MANNHFLLKEIYPLIFEGKGYDKKQIQLVGNFFANNYNGSLINFTINDKNKIITLHCVSNGNLFNKEISFKEFVKKMSKLNIKKDRYIMLNENKPVKEKDIEKKLALEADLKNEILIYFEANDKTKVILYKTVNNNCVIIRNSITYEKFLHKYF